MTESRPAEAVEPRLAASLILLTRTQNSALLTLLLKRTSKASFMPSALVFPGGGLERQDSQQAAHLFEDGERFPLWQEWGFSGESAAIAQRLCALRECSEEAGEQLITALDTQSISCVGRWLTPERLPKRFDTSFWLGVLEAPLAVEVDQAEVTEGSWWSPSQALTAYSKQEIELAPPTIRLLADLSTLEHNPQLMDWWRRTPDDRGEILSDVLSGRPHPTPICPNLIKHREKSELWLCFPSDPHYHDPDRRYEPNLKLCQNRLWRPLDQAASPWRTLFSDT